MATTPEQMALLNRERERKRMDEENRRLQLQATEASDERESQLRQEQLGRVSEGVQNYADRVDNQQRLAQEIRGFEQRRNERRPLTTTPQSPEPASPLVQEQNPGRQILPGEEVNYETGTIKRLAPQQRQSVLRNQQRVATALNNAPADALTLDPSQTRMPQFASQPSGTPSTQTNTSTESAPDYSDFTSVQTPERLALFQGMSPEQQRNMVAAWRSIQSRKSRSQTNQPNASRGMTQRPSVPGTPVANTSPVPSPGISQRQPVNYTPRFPTRSAASMRQSSAQNQGYLTQNAEESRRRIQDARNQASAESAYRRRLRW